jgi:hypothetical protein
LIWVTVNKGLGEREGVIYAPELETISRRTELNLNPILRDHNRVKINLPRHPQLLNSLTFTHIQVDRQLPGACALLRWA